MARRTSATRRQAPSARSPRVQVGAEELRQRASYTPAAPTTTSRGRPQPLRVDGRSAADDHTAESLVTSSEIAISAGIVQTARRKRRVQPGDQNALAHGAPAPHQMHNRLVEELRPRCRSPQPGQLLVDRLAQPSHVGHRHCLMRLRRCATQSPAVIAQIDVRLEAGHPLPRDAGTLQAANRSSLLPENIGPTITSMRPHFVTADSCGQLRRIMMRAPLRFQKIRSPSQRVCSMG